MIDYDYDLMGIGESGRPRQFWKLKIFGSNPDTRTIILCARVVQLAGDVRFKI